MQQYVIFTVTISCIQGLLDKLKIIGNHFNIRMVFHTRNALRSFFFQTPNLCEWDVDETSRLLSVTIEEHKDYIKWKDLKSKIICEHTWQYCDIIPWIKIKTLEKECNTEKKNERISDNFVDSRKMFVKLSINYDLWWFGILKEEVRNNKILYDIYGE